MELEEYRALTARRGYIAAGSQAHLFMTEAAREAQRVTAELNTGYHTAGQLRALFSSGLAAAAGDGAVQVTFALENG